MKTCGTMSDNKWQRVTTSGVTSGRTGDNEWQKVTVNKNEWQRVSRSGTTSDKVTTKNTMSDNEWH